MEAPNTHTFIISSLFCFSPLAPPTDAAMFRKLGGREFEFEFSGTSSEADPKFIDRRDERMDGDMEEFVVGFIVGGAIIYSKTCALKRRVGDFGKIQKGKTKSESKFVK